MYTSVLQVITSDHMQIPIQVRLSSLMCYPGSTTTVIISTRVCREPGLVIKGVHQHLNNLQNVFRSIKIMLANYNDDYVQMFMKCHGPIRYGSRAS